MAVNGPKHYIHGSLGSHRTGKTDDKAVMILEHSF